jgi:antitoxin CcdA
MMPSIDKKSGSLSIDETPVAQAPDLKINVKSAAEDGITKAIKQQRERLWRLENAEAIRHSNDYVEKHGLPLAQYRKF